MYLSFFTRNIDFIFLFFIYFGLLKQFKINAYKNIDHIKNLKKILVKSYNSLAIIFELSLKSKKYSLYMIKKYKKFNLICIIFK